MNEAGREVLIEAALSGHRQERGYLHAAHAEADCALGLLHLTMHAVPSTTPFWKERTRAEAVACRYNGLGFEACLVRLRQRYGLSLAEMNAMVSLNDIGRADFLTIARKLGTGEMVDNER